MERRVTLDSARGISKGEARTFVFIWNHWTNKFAPSFLQLRPSRRVTSRQVHAHIPLQLGLFFADRRPSQMDAAGMNKNDYVLTVDLRRDFLPRSPVTITVIWGETPLAVVVLVRLAIIATDNVHKYALIILLIEHTDNSKPRQIAEAVRILAKR